MSPWGAMQRFLLQNNIARYEQKLKAAGLDPAERMTLQALLADARRDLALFDSEQLGSKPRPYDGAANEITQPEQFHHVFMKAFNDSANLYLIIDPGPGLKIVDANDAYCAATMTIRSEIAGRPLFAVFPDNPADRGADGVSNLFHSIKIAVESRLPHEMAIQRYDVRDQDGAFQKRYWRPVNSPLFDEQGAVKFILHHVADVTEQSQSACAKDPSE